MRKNGGFTVLYIGIYIYSFLKFFSENSVHCLKNSRHKVFEYLSYKVETFPKGGAYYYEYNHIL